MVLSEAIVAKNNRNHSFSLDIPTQLSRRLRRFSDRSQPLMMGKERDIAAVL
jgi:hypothetical protein